MVDLSEAERLALSSIGDARPATWIVADDLMRQGDATAAAEAAGARVARRLTLGDAAGQLVDRPYGSLLLAEVGDDPDACEDALLDLIDQQAADPSLPAVVSFPLAALDRVAARVGAPYATLLCQPRRSERVAAIELARVAPPLHFAEADTTTEAMRLQRLADEVGRIARTLAGLAEFGGEPQVEAVSDGLIGYRAETAIHARPAVAAVVRAEDIRAIIRLRRQRDRLFTGDMFADPAWDMMLDLMAARIERMRVAVSSLCIAAAVPATTALRWIKTLTDTGVFVRVADPTDRRRIFIELSDAAAKSVLQVLGDAKRTGASLV